MIAELAEPKLGTFLNHKECPKCKVHKPLSAYNKDSKAPDHKQYYCRECHRTASQTWMTKHREIEVSHKVCGKCKEDKVLTSYGKNRCYKDGLQNWCKPCVSVRQKGYLDKVTVTTEVPVEGTKHFRMTQKINGMTLKPSKAQESGTTHAQRLLTTLLDLTDRTTQLIGELQFAVTSNSL